MLHKTHAELLATMPSREMAEWMGFFAYDAAKEEQRQELDTMKREQAKQQRKTWKR